MRDGENIGRMYHHHGGPRDGQWSWHVSVEPQIKGRSNNGTEDTPEEAKAAFKATLLGRGHD